MSNDLSKAAEEFISSHAVDAKKDSIINAANTDYGKNVMEMLRKNDFDRAVKSGDMNALKSSISQVLQTQDGERLMRELAKIMEK